MNSQMQSHRAHDEVDPHSPAFRSGVHHGDEQQQQQHEHGKKSVLKKVKAKAKKIKDSITGHAHAHDHDNHEEVDNDEEEDAELHGAPMYDTTETRPYLPGQGAASIQHDVMAAGGRLTSSTAAPVVADHRHRPAYSTNPSFGTAAPVVSDHHASAYTANPSFGTPAPEIGDYRGFAPEQVGILKQDVLKFGGGQTHQAAAAPATGHTIGHAGVRQHGVLTHHEHTAGVQTGIGSRPAEPVAHLPGYGGSVVRDSGLGVGVHQQHGVLTHQGHIQGTPHLSVTRAQTQTILGVKPAEPAAHSVGYGGVHDSSMRAGVQHGVLTHQGQIHDQPRFETQTQTGLGIKPAAHFVGYGCVHVSGGLGEGDRKGQISTQERPILDGPIDLETDPSSPLGSREPENYQSKVTDPTGMGGEEIGVTHILHSLDRLTHHDQPVQQSREQDGRSYAGARSHVQFRSDPVSDKTSSFGQRPESDYRREAQRGSSHTEKAAQAKDVMASKLDDQQSTISSITEKAAQAKDVIASKLGYGGDEQKSTQSVAEKAAQAKDVMASKIGYGGEDQRSTTSSITEKAAQAKDAIASKLGYGSDDEQKSTTSSVTDYGKKVGSTVQATLAPVYDKVAGAGEAVVSKFQGSPDTPRPTQEGSSDFDDDKGMSVKEYVTEKLSPGEDAKALSEVISGALTSGDDDKERKAEPKGRVTFSAKVERQLGISNQDEHEVDEEDGGGSSPGRAMVDRLKGAMTSWWGKGGENEPSAVAFYDTPKEGFSVTKPQEQGKPRLQ